MDYDLTQLHYIEQGEGPLLLFLHGWGEDARSYLNIMNLLSHQYKCVSVDLPGWGKSPLNQHLTIQDCADILQRLIHSKRWKLEAMIGHSWGGKIATCYALHYPVPNLILASSSTCRPRFSFKTSCKIFQYKFTKWLVKIPLLGDRFKPRLSKYGSRDYKNSVGFIRDLFLTSIHTYFDDELENIKVPTLIYWGEKDKETPLYMAKRMAKRIPHATLKVVRNGDHFALFTCRYNFTTVVEYFLKVGRNE